MADADTRSELQTVSDELAPPWLVEQAAAIYISGQVQ